MFTKEGLEEVNKELAAIPVKNKQYVQVHERIKGFRRLAPQGTITTEIVCMNDGVVTMKATITDEDGKVIGTGYAQEKETSSYINKTSFIENCETSAVGRALGFCGIGIDGSMASAEEVANAITQQNDIKQQEKNTDLIPHGAPVDVERLEKLIAELERTGVSEKKIMTTYKVKDLRDLTEAQYISAMNRLEKTETA